VRSFTWPTTRIGVRRTVVEGWRVRQQCGMQQQRASRPCAARLTGVRERYALSLASYLFLLIVNYS
jgi:hypothetical protein